MQVNIYRRGRTWWARWTKVMQDTARIQAVCEASRIRILHELLALPVRTMLVNTEPHGSRDGRMPAPT